MRGPLLRLHLTHQLLFIHTYACACTRSLHALAETVLALSRIPHKCSAATLSGIRNLVPRLEKARLYRGRGGEMVRGGACRLLECIALAEHPMTKRAQV